MQNVAERKEVINAMCKLAKMGHLGAAKYLKENYALRVYTQAEIDILNKRTTLDLTKENLI